MTSEQTSRLVVLHPLTRVKLDAALTEPWPEKWQELLKQLREQERQSRGPPREWFGRDD
jgi:hypothetical protein